MTREEAIGWLKDIKDVGCETMFRDWSYEVAIDMAIEALQTLEAVERIKTEVLPQTDLLRCKDCRWYSKGENDSDSWALCTVHTGQYIGVDDDEFCSYGERREP